MTVVRIKGFQIFKDRYGKERCYHRSTRTAVNLDRFPLGTVEFVSECERIAKLKAAAAAGLGAKPGTLGRLIAEYKAHASFQDLAPKTRSDYQRYFEYLRSIEDTPLARFDRKLVVRIRDKAGASGRRRSANYLRQVMSIIFAWGVERGYLNENPASNIKSIKRAKDARLANRPWTDEERHVVISAAPRHMRSAIALMMFAALGPKDALALPRSAYKDGLISLRRSKTGEPVYMPAVSQLAEILDEALDHNAITICASTSGRPWTIGGFNTAWQKLRARLEKEGKVGRDLTLYGLRHTVAVILRECGLEDRAIADVLGHKGTSMASIYTRGADIKDSTRGSAKILNLEMNRRRTNIVKPSV